MKRALLLNGFMASGKTLVGRLVAERTGHPFVDLDQLLERESGLSVQQIFSTRGEAHFRELERACLSRILDEAAGAARPPVVALGGGALLSRALRLRALDEAVVITLRASPAVLAQRAATQHDRPLLGGAQPERRIEDLLELRALTYAEAHATLDADQAPERVAEAAQQAWQRDGIAVAAGLASYSVEIAQSFAAARLAELSAEHPLTVLVSDRTVAALHGGGIADAVRPGPPVRVDLEPGEAHKLISSVEAIWHAAQAGGADRRSLFVGLGGGVVTDITGFAAASWMRGVSWVGIPTTLLAMVDASVGGKTGVDLGSAKNAVGAFWQPRAVLCDVAHLATESRRGFVSALAEVVKTALIGDPALFELLETRHAAVAAREPSTVAEIVRRCVRVKARIVSADERESGLRAVLNLGHTVGHALEAQAGYTALTHGEAVSLGLVAALRIGQRLGVTSEPLAQRTLRVLEQLGLPTSLANQPVASALTLIGHDKKRAGKKLRYVVAEDIGRVSTLDLGIEELREHARAVLH